MSKNLIPWRKKSEALERPEREHPFESLHRQMNDLFENFFGEMGRGDLQPWSSGGSVNPRFEVSESEEAVEVAAELPGMNEKDIQVTLDDNVLTIKGEKKARTDEKSSELLYQGIAARAFERTFQLADHVEVKGASLEHGLLHIDLVREIPEAKRTRSIPIGPGETAVAPQIEATVN